MELHEVKVYPSKATPDRTDQLAWKIAEVAADAAVVDQDVVEMVINRIIDNAAVAIAAINRRPVANARAQALAHPRLNGATVFGLPSGSLFEAEWAGWANSVAVRELDFHDTLMAADYSHPGDNIPPLMAVAQQCGRSGADLIRAVATAYEIQVNLVKAIDLHSHGIDHVAHLGPAVAAGIGSLLALPPEVIYQAVQQAVHLCFSTRQSRKGAISSWKAYAPAHAGKIAVEAVDRAMRGEGSPSPIYEGDDSVIAWLLAGKNAIYQVPMPSPGEPKRAILETYTKEHSVAYHCQAIVDLAFLVRDRRPDVERIASVTIHTKHHSHRVTGTGANDPQKMDPAASRETLDHSIMFAFAVALQDGEWHHVKSYLPARVGRPDTVRLWHKIKTREDPEWNRLYDEPVPGHKAHGGRVEILFENGEKLVEQILFPNAHPLGATPFSRPDYVAKLERLSEGIISARQCRLFIELVQNLPRLSPRELSGLNLEVDASALECAERDTRGIF
ncbi:MAG: MmgE/PrpD family protein [Smithellaceae bacterium]|nr:MmgE/PrpD family protein [Smithellaceae bacterium]